MSHVLHADFISLGPGQASSVREGVIEAAAALSAVPGASQVFALVPEGETGGTLGLFFLLVDLSALEAFGTDQRYTAFLQKVVAPVLGSLAGADVRTEGTLDDRADEAACLALSAPPNAYDWEVKAALETWRDSIDAPGLTGLAIGERQRFRGLGLVAAEGASSLAPPSLAKFGTTWLAGRLRRLT